MDSQQFPRGQTYLVICPRDNKALRVLENSTKYSYQKSKLWPSEPNPQDNAQLFMLQKIGTKDRQYEIINCVSDYVLEGCVGGGEVVLRHGKLASSQMWFIEGMGQQRVKFEGRDYQCYWIKTELNGNKALALNDSLKVQPLDPKNPAQMFCFVPVTSNFTLEHSVLIVNNLTCRLLDVPESSRREGQRLIQWDKHRRWNQRWRLQKCGKGYLIKNVLSQLFVDVAGESRENGAKVIQWARTQGLNQVWALEPCGNGLHKVRACHEPSLFLAVKGGKKENRAVIEMTSEENPSIYWRIQGNFE